MMIKDLTINRDSLKDERIEMLHLGGSLDTHSFESLESAIEAIFSEGTYALIIAMTEIEYVSSAGLGTIVSATNQAQKHGGNVVLLAPSEPVLEVLKLLGLVGVLKVAPDLAAAKLFFKAKPPEPQPHQEALRDEWTQWHLTPGGWRRGSMTKHPAKFVEKPVPPDRVLTCVYSEYQRAEGTPVSKEMSIDWRGPDPTVVVHWIEYHGDCPQSL